MKATGKNNFIKLHPTLETLNRSKYKKMLLDQFQKKYKDTCDAQNGWIKQPFVKRMRDVSQIELNKHTFRPIGPQGKFEWLNTININDVMKQYETKYSDFKFLGAVPIDFDDLPQLGISTLPFKELLSKGIKRVGIIFNLDESWKSGSHWVAASANLDKGEVYFFDSYGVEPEKRIRKFMRRVVKFCQDTNIKAKADYNRIRHQYGDSECGVYSINFLLRTLRGDTFEQICESKTPDKVINQCRKVYFK
jgi:hypothetical protein